MQNKCDLAQEMYETIIETPNVPNSIRANAYKQLGEYKLCQLTTGSWGSVYMLRYEACGKFGEHKRGIRVAQGTAKCNCILFKLCKEWFACSIAHACRWQQQHSPTHLLSVDKLTHYQSRSTDNNTNRPHSAKPISEATETVALFKILKFLVRE